VRRRGDGDTDEELEGGQEELAASANGDLGSVLMGVQEGAGNAALASMLSQIESGAEPASSLLPGAPKAPDRHRAEAAGLGQRLAAAKANPFALRVGGELVAFERRLESAAADAWAGTDPAVLGTELEEVEARLGRAQREEEAVAALAAVDRRRAPLSERTKRAVMERTALTKPGMFAYAPEDFEELLELAEQLNELQRELVENRAAVGEGRGALGTLSDATTEYVAGVAAKLLDGLGKAEVVLGEHEVALKAISGRHATANAEDREKLNQLMSGLAPLLQREPTLALDEGASRQEIDYLLKKAWLEQHNATQQLSREEVWHIVSGFSPEEGTTSYFDLPWRMDRWRMHMALDYGVMEAVDVDSSDSEIRDALFGGHAGSDKRAYVAAEVLGRDDARNPRFFYGTSRVTPKKDFWSTNEGKVVKRNWSSNQHKLIDAFNSKSEDLVKVVHDVLEQRKALKGVVVKVGETLKWAD
jgi:hypothetical protein